MFSTKERKQCLELENREKLLKYIWGITNNKKCHLYRINCVKDHLHIVTHIHPTVALSNFVKSIKTASSSWIKQENTFPKFEAWQIGYAAFTYSIDAKDDLIKYVKNQEQHHSKISFLDELKQLLVEQKVDFNEKYLL